MLHRFDFVFQFVIKRSFKFRRIVLGNIDDVKTNRNPICDLPKLIGVCKALLPRFYYDRAEGRCKFFFYGGCKGNDNNFLTPSACRDECGGMEPITTVQSTDSLFSTPLIKQFNRPYLEKFILLLCDIMIRITDPKNHQAENKGVKCFIRTLLGAEAKKKQTV